MTDFKDGDYFAWKYKDLPLPHDHTLTYWCKSQRALCIKGELYDTFWSDSSGRSWVDPTKVELEFLGNLNDYDVAKFGNHLYYDRKDVIDTRHSNSSNANIYVRKGALRSRETMLEYAKEKRERADSALRSAMYDLERWNQKIAEIEAAEDLKEIWL